MLVTYTFEERGQDFACQFSVPGVSQEKGCFLHIFVILVLTKGVCIPFTALLSLAVASFSAIKMGGGRGRQRQLPEDSPPRVATQKGEALKGHVRNLWT